jgi:hypothetical protein
MSLDDFDHPCRQTCSGWRQGFDKGKLLESRKVSEMENLLKLADKVIHQFSNDLAPKTDENSDLFAAWWIQYDKFINPKKEEK